MNAQSKEVTTHNVQKVLADKAMLGVVPVNYRLRPDYVQAWIPIDWVNNPGLMMIEFSDDTFVEFQVPLAEFDIDEGGLDQFPRGHSVASEEPKPEDAPSGTYSATGINMPQTTANNAVGTAAKGLAELAHQLVTPARPEPEEH